MSSKREPDFSDVELDDEKRATEALEDAGGLPEGNPFTEVVERLRDDGRSWREVYDALNEVFGPVDQAAYESGWEFVPEWRVAAIEHDANATSGERYEYYERTAETAEEAEEMVRRHTACRVEQSKTEQVGVAKVS